jgi:DNA-binding NarL/FixJ family response regulator
MTIEQSELTRTRGVFAVGLEPTKYLLPGVPARGSSATGERERPTSTALSARRRAAIERDATQPETFALARLWQDLAAGNFQFRDDFCTTERAYGVFERVLPGSARPVPARMFQVLSRFLLGENQKSLGIELKLVASTIASRIQGAFRAMGLHCSGWRAPVLLIMAAHAARRPSAICGRLAQLSNAERHAGALYVVSVPRPDRTFPVLLSNAEAAVVRELVAGCSYPEISQARATSARTVANQLASAFRKLQVSGRGELIQYLVEHALAGSDLPDTTAKDFAVLAQGGAVPLAEACPVERLPNGFSQPEPAPCVAAVARSALALTAPAGAFSSAVAVASGKVRARLASLSGPAVCAE